MRNKLLGLALVGAAVAITFAACGEEGPVTSTCGGDGDCQTGELCHPLAKVCVTSCTSGNDCPSESKNCDALTYGGTKGADGGITGGTTTGKFCQCSTAALCGAGSDPNIICAAEDKICTTKCTSDGQCGTGRTCDTTTGDCKTTAGTGGGAGGGGGGSCDWTSCSPADFKASALTCTTSGCAAGASCTGTGKSTCGAGEYCEGSACSYPARPRQADCSNFYSGSFSGGPAWTPASAGAVIYDVAHIAHAAGEFDGGTNCGTTQFNDPNSFCHCPFNDTEWKMSIRAYRTDADWPATRTAFYTSNDSLFYVNTSGTSTDIAASSTNTFLLPNVGYNVTSGNAKDIEFRVFLCAPNAQNAFQPGFQIQTGANKSNEACQDLP